MSGYFIWGFIVGTAFGLMVSGFIYLAGVFS